jgi:outer membrane protein assembly factor BamB
VVISERDLDRFGAVLGPANAQKNVDIKMNDLSNLKLNPKLETITIPQITLYGVTSSGLLQAIDSETGRTLWKVGVGKPGAPVEAVGCSDLYVSVVNGSDLYLLKSDNGEFVWKRRVVGAPGAGPAITSHLVFVPMVNGAMEAYPIDNTKMPPIIYKSTGRALWQPVYTGVNVAWPTDRGHLYVSGGTQHRISFRLEAKDAISSSAAVMPGGRLVVSSVDGYVYCLQENNGVVLWRFSSGEPMQESPVVYGDAVFAVTTDGNLFKMDRDGDPDKVWTTPGIAKVIGASTTRVYCLDHVGGFVVLDKATGSHLGSLATSSLNFPFTNKETDRIFLVNSRGMIQCLREIQQEFPIIYVPLKKPEEPATKIQKKPTKSLQETPAEGTDPFGAESKSEIKAEEKPAERDEKKGDDPFGTNP